MTHSFLQSSKVHVIQFFPCDDTPDVDSALLLRLHGSFTVPVPVLGNALGHVVIVSVTQETNLASYQAHHQKLKMPILCLPVDLSCENPHGA